MDPYRCEKCDEILDFAGTDGRKWKYHCPDCHIMVLKDKRWEYIPTPAEIEEVKREYREEHTVIGTDKPVIIKEATAIAVLSSRKRHKDYINSVHESHDMTDWESKIMAPAGTERFYSYRECTKCEGAQFHHPAGRFIDNELKKECMG